MIPKQCSRQKFYYQGIAWDDSIQFKYLLKFYDFYVPHFLITLSELIKILQPYMFQIGIIVNPDCCKFLDEYRRQLNENEVIQNFIHKTKYITIIYTNIRQQEYDIKLEDSPQKDDTYLGIRAKTHYDINNYNKNLHILSKSCLGKNSIFKAFPERNSRGKWKVFIIGPRNSPYANGIYELECTLPYVFSSEETVEMLQFQFITQLLHPNFYGGKIAFKYDHENQAQCIQNSLLKIINLLKNPNLEEALDLDCAEEYKNNRDIFIQRAQNINQQFAKTTTITQMIKVLMGDVPIKLSDNRDLQKEFQDWITFWK